MTDIRAMTAADLSLGMRLKEQAGWNQTDADWQRVLDLQPDGCFVAEWDGRPVGTAAAVVFGSVAWIMMVLVDEALRGRGIGTRLMQHALADLDARSIRAIRLDATPLGRPVYEKLGFQTEYELARFEHPGAVVTAAASTPEVTPEHLDTVYALDRQATGTDRSRLLARLYSERPSAFAVFCDKTFAGYRAFRTGSRAVQIGPAAANAPEAGRALLDGILAQCGPVPVFVDIPLDNHPAIEWAQTKQFRLQRRLTRMWRGERVVDRPTQIWAAFGPEKG